MQQPQILNDGPHKLMTLRVMETYTNVLMHRGSIISIWRSMEPATFEGYALSRRAPLATVQCPTCAGFADCDGLHD
jgi:hypothetical protein